MHPFPFIPAPVLKQIRTARASSKPIAVVELPDTFLGRLRGLFCLDKPKRK